MRLAALSIPLLTLALAACQAVAPPDLATLPHATLVSSHVDVSPERTDTFRVIDIDTRSVLDVTDISVKNVEVDRTHLIAAGREVKVEIDALAFYGNAARRLFWDSMHIQGTVAFVPAADAKYVVRGSLTPEASSVWIENDATHEVVGRRISAHGRGASAAGQ